MNVDDLISIPTRLDVLIIAMGKKLSYKNHHSLAILFDLCYIGCCIITF